MSDQQISEDEGSVKSQSEMDQLQQLRRAGTKKKRTQGNKINVGVSKVATNLGSLQISPAVPTSTPVVAQINPSPTIAINSHPKILRVDNKMTLTHNVIQQWIDSIREFSAQSITFNHLTYIAEEGRFAIDARMKQKFEDGHEWESWPRDKFLTNLLICWPAPNTQEGQSLEVMFRALEPKIHFNNAYNDVTRFVTNIKIFYAKEKNKSPGLDDDTGRQKALVKILMDKLKPDEETLAYFNTSVSDGGLPPTVEEFTTKIMDKAFKAQEALHLVEAARLTVTSKKRSADSDHPHQTANNQPSKRQNRAPSAHPGSAVPSADQRSGPPPTCKGCGWIHFGECLMRTHPDFNNSNHPWHLSPSGQRYFNEKGLTKLPWEGPYLDPNSSWPNKPSRPSANKHGSNTQHKGGREPYKGRGRGNQRGMIYPIAAPVLDSDTRVLKINCTLTTTIHHRQITALLDSGSPDNYASETLGEWMRGLNGHMRTNESCVCSALGTPKSCSCSKESMTVSVTIEFNNLNVSFEVTALILPINGYDLIIGWPTLVTQKDKLLSLITANLTHDSHVNKSCTAIETVLFGALLTTQPTENTNNIHIANILDGPLQEEGDDLSDRFESEAPWDTDSQSGESPSVGLISLIDIQGSDTFKNKIRSVCLRYKHCFSQAVQPLPAKVVPLTLEVDRNLWEVPRNAGPPRPQSDTKLEEIKLQVDKMLKLGVIQPSQAPYYSHPHLTRKPDGSWRFCIDFRQLNNASRSLGWPIPNIELLLRRVGKHNPQYFGKFDLTSGYHQTALSENSRAMTAFLTHYGLFEWLRCPFGLKGAPSYFQRAMHTEVLSGLIYSICEIYIDDILFWGSSEEDYLSHLETILIRLSDKGITLNPNKCKLGLEEVEYTGHVLDRSGLSFSEKKKESIVNFKLPENQKELRSFLGLANYFRDHIRNHSIIVHPLHDMVKHYKPKQRLTWSQETKEAFNDIKEAINACPKLYYLDDISPVYLQTDASDYGVGAYLFQVVNDVEHPIMFLSKTFKNEQKRWSAADKECYAIIWAFKELEHLIRDRYFVLRTDHKNLTYLNLENSGKVRRWKLLVQEYNCGVEHIRGEDNFVADDFSRLIPHIREDESDDVDSLWDTALNTDVGPSHPMTVDPVDEVVDDALDIPVPQPQTDTCLPFAAPINDEEQIPKDKYKLISSVHNSIVGHMGVDKTCDRLIQQGHRWKNMRAHISTFIRKKCACCQKMFVNKIISTSDPFTLGSYDIMQKIAMDSTGHLPKDANGNEYLVSIIDHFSRFIELYPVPDLSAKTFATCLLAWIGRYGAPHQILSDKGTQFCNSVIAELCRMVGSEQIFTMTASKQENGIVERSIKEIRRHLRNIVFTTNLMDNWSTYLPLVQRILNADTKESIGVSPAQLLFGNSVQLDRGIFLPNNPNSSENISDWMQKMLKAQSELIHVARVTQENRDDEHMSTPQEPPTSFPINSYVLVTYIDRPPTTLHAPNEGPMRVVSSVKQGKITLQNLVTGNTDEYHISRLRPFYYENEDTPKQTANRDNQEWDVDFIVDHAGDKSSRKTLQFRVRWVGYGENDDTWQPYADLRHNTKLHEYLRTHKMRSLIPVHDK